LSKAFCLAWFYLRKNISVVVLNYELPCDVLMNRRALVFGFFFASSQKNSTVKLHNETIGTTNGLWKRTAQRASIRFRRKIVFVRLRCSRKSDFSRNHFTKVSRGIYIITYMNWNMRYCQVNLLRVSAIH